eukprot:s2424_g3.t1
MISDSIEVCRMVSEQGIYEASEVAFGERYTHFAFSVFRGEFSRKQREDALRISGQSFQGEPFRNFWSATSGKRQALLNQLPSKAEARIARLQGEGLKRPLSSLSLQDAEQRTPEKILLQRHALAQAAANAGVQSTRAGSAKEEAATPNLVSSVHAPCLLLVVFVPCDLQSPAIEFASCRPASSGPTFAAFGLELPGKASEGTPQTSSRHVATQEEKPLGADQSPANALTRSYQKISEESQPAPGSFDRSRANVDPDRPKVDRSDGQSATRQVEPAEPLELSEGVVVKINDQRRSLRERRSPPPFQNAVVPSHPGFSHRGFVPDAPREGGPVARSMNQLRNVTNNRFQESVQVDNPQVNFVNQSAHLHSQDPAMTSLVEAMAELHHREVLTQSEARAEALRNVRTEELMEVLRAHESSEQQRVKAVIQSNEDVLHREGFKYGETIKHESQEHIRQQQAHMHEKVQAYQRVVDANHRQSSSNKELEIQELRQKAEEERRTQNERIAQLEQNATSPHDRATHREESSPAPTQPYTPTEAFAGADGDGYEPPSDDEGDNDGNGDDKKGGDRVTGNPGGNPPNPPDPPKGSGDKGEEKKDKKKSKGSGPPDGGDDDGGDSEDSDEKFRRRMIKFLGGNFELKSDEKPKIKEADTIKIPRFPLAETYRSWRIKTREAVVAASTDPDIAFSWVSESWKENQTLEAFRKVAPFSTLDAKLLSALTNIITGDFARKIDTFKETEATAGRIVRGRQVLFKLHDHFSANIKHGATYALQDLFSVQLRGDNLKSFISNWDQVLAGITQIPDESVLETLFYKQVKNCKAIQHDMNEYHRAIEGDRKERTIFLFQQSDPLGPGAA